MKRISIELTEEGKATLEGIRSKGMHKAREVNRAHILLALGKGVKDEQIEQVLGVSRALIWRTRAAYVRGGIKFAIEDEGRSGAPRRYTAKQEAEVISLACERSPKGRKRWTVNLLTEEARKRPDLGNVSRETVRRWLKKTF